MIWHEEQKKFVQNLPYTLEFDEAKHEYKVDQKIVPSVNHIIDVVCGRKYTGDPWYGDRGKAAARAVELDLLQVLDESSVDENVMPYLQGWRKFVRENNYQVKYCELALGLPGEFAGRIDHFGLVNGIYSLFDTKCVKQLKNFDTKTQLSGYESLMWVNKVIQYDLPIAGLQLMDDGTYHWEPYQNNPNLWTAVMTLYKEKVRKSGEVTERLNVPDLKSGNPKGFMGSNPILS